MYSNEQRPASGFSWWPQFVGGFSLPLVTLLLKDLIPLHFAAAVAFTLVFGGLGFIYVKAPPSPGWTLSKWLGGVALGAVVCALLAYVMPWA